MEMLFDPGILCGRMSGNPIDGVVIVVVHTHVAVLVRVWLAAVDGMFEPYIVEYRDILLFWFCLPVLR